MSSIKNNHEKVKRVRDRVIENVPDQNDFFQLILLGFILNTLFVSILACCYWKQNDFFGLNMNQVGIYPFPLNVFTKT